MRLIHLITIIINNYIYIKYENSRRTMSDSKNLDINKYQGCFINIQ